MMGLRKPYIAMVLVLGSGLLTLAVAVLLLMSSPSVSQALPLDEEANPCGDEFQISTIPSLPTQDNTITITYSAVWYNLPTPVHQSLGIADHAIRLDAVYYVPEFFLPVVVTWREKVDGRHICPSLPSRLCNRSQR